MITPSWNAAAINTTQITTRAARCRPRTPATRNIPAAIATITIDVPMSGCDEHERERDERDPQSRITSWMVGERVPHLGQARREHDDQAELGELRGRDLESRHLEPSLGAGVGGPEEGDLHQQQGDEHARVDEAGIDLQEAVVERRHHAGSRTTPIAAVTVCC